MKGEERHREGRTGREWAEPVRPSVSAPSRPQPPPAACSASPAQLLACPVPNLRRVEGGKFTCFSE